MEFTGDIVRKKGSRSLLAVEATKARLAGEIGKKIGLYYVPRVLNFDEDTCVLEFERLRDLIILHDLAVRKDQRLPELLRKAGQALAVVHEKLLLPGDMYYPLPSEWIDSSGEDVSIHGDFTLQNVGLNEVSGQLVILDWSAAPLLGRTPTSGSRYFDILWFVANVFSSAPNEGILSWNAEGMSDAFIKGYIHAINPKNLDKFAIYWPKIMRLYRKSVWYIARHRRFCRASVYLAARILMYFRLWYYKRRFS